jgi:hypothetical protein
MGKPPCDALVHNQAASRRRREDVRYNGVLTHRDVSAGLLLRVDNLAMVDYHSISGGPLTEVPTYRLGEFGFRVAEEELLR